MGDLEHRLSRLERELRAWRLAAIACVAILSGLAVFSCDNGPRPYARGSGKFTDLTVTTDGAGELVITPQGITITGTDGVARSWP